MLGGGGIIAAGILHNCADNRDNGRRRLLGRQGIGIARWLGQNVIAAQINCRVETKR